MMQKVRSWLLLILGFSVVAMFMFVIGPAMERRIPDVGKMAAYIERTGLNAGGIYYTDVEETAAAELYMTSIIRPPSREQ